MVISLFAHFKSGFSEIACYLTECTPTILSSNTAGFIFQDERSPTINLHCW